MPEFKEDVVGSHGEENRSSGSTRKPHRRRNPIASNSVRHGVAQKSQIGPCAVDALTFAGSGTPCEYQEKLSDQKEKEVRGDRTYSTSVVGGEPSDSTRSATGDGRQFRRRQHTERRKEQWNVRGRSGGSRNRGEREVAAEAKTPVKCGVLGKIFRAVWPFGKSRSQRNSDSPSADAAANSAGGRQRQRSGRRRRYQ